MELVILPLLILPFRWKNYDLYDWAFTVFYVSYACFLVTADLPQNTRLSDFYLGIPAFSYVAFIFSDWQTHYPEQFVRVLGGVGVSIAYISLLVFF